MVVGDKKFGVVLYVLQSLSKVVGTHAVLRRKSIYTVCYTQYSTPPPPPSPINVVFSIRIPILIKLGEQWHTTLNRGRGGGIDIG
jgi:hypothetical protein